MKINRSTKALYAENSLYHLCPNLTVVFVLADTRVHLIDAGQQLQFVLALLLAQSNHFRRQCIVLSSHNYCHVNIARAPLFVLQISQPKN